MVSSCENQMIQISKVLKSLNVRRYYYQIRHQSCLFQRGDSHIIRTENFRLKYTDLSPTEIHTFINNSSEHNYVGRTCACAFAFFTYKLPWYANFSCHCCDTRNHPAYPYLTYISLSPSLTRAHTLLHLCIFCMNDYLFPNIASLATHTVKYVYVFDSSI